MDSITGGLFRTTFDLGDDFGLIASILTDNAGKTGLSHAELTVMNPLNTGGLHGFAAPECTIL